MDQTQKASNLTFEEALKNLKAGRKLARQGWKGKCMWVLAQFPDENSKMTHPHMYIEYPDGHPAYHNGSRVPCVASQIDMLAEDWMIVE